MNRRAGVNMYKTVVEAAGTRDFSMKNVGTIDRLLRAVAGIILISLVFIGPKTPWGWVGLVPLLTALFAYCPAYSLFGIRTCPLNKG
mgnify:FL=1